MNKLYINKCHFSEWLLLNICFQPILNEIKKDMNRYNNISQIYIFISQHLFCNLVTIWTQYKKYKNHLKNEAIQENVII